MKCSKWRQQGLTLVEIIVVIAILGLVLLMASSVFAYGLNSFGYGERRAQMQFDVRQAVERIGSQVRMAETMRLLSAAQLSTMISGNSFNPQLRYIYIRTNPSTGHRTLVHRIGTVEQTILSNIPYNLTLRFESRSAGKLLYFDLAASTGGNSFALDSQVAIMNIGNGSIDGASGVAVEFGPMTDAQRVLADSLSVYPGALIGRVILVPTTGPYGSEIRWSTVSLDVAPVGDPATEFDVTRTAVDRDIVLTASFTLNAAHIERSYTVAVPRMEALTFLTPDDLPYALTGQPYTITLSVGGGDGLYTYSIEGGTLSGFTIGATSGILSGTPTFSGSRSVEIKVVDTSLNTATNTFNLLVYDGVAVVNTSLTAGTRTYDYAHTFTATGGSGGYTFTASGLPSGLSLDSNGALTGVVSTAGTYVFSVTAQDDGGRIGSRQFSLTINRQPVSAANSTLSPANRSVVRNTNFTMTAVVVDSISGKPIAGLLPAAFTVTADSPNQFTLVSIVETSTPGTYTITAQYQNSGTRTIRASVDGVQITGVVNVTVTNN